MIFLLDYNRKCLALELFRKYDDSEREKAKGDRLALELSHNQAGILREVVILEAPSEAAIRRSHARYFGPDAVAKLVETEGQALAAGMLSR